MFLTIMFLCGLAVDLTVIFAFNWLTHWYDFWILIVGFIVGILIGVILILTTIFIGTLFDKKDKDYSKPSKFHSRTVMRACEFMLQFFRVKVLVRGMDKLPTDKPILFIENHQAIFDSLASVWTFRGFPKACVVKEALMKAFLMGPFIHASGFLGLNRSSARDGVKVINKAADYIKNKDLSIIICPEGTRSGTYEMNPFHNGSFKIALKAECDIALIAIQNSYIVKKRWPWKSTKLYLDVVDVMKYEDIKDKTTQEISEEAFTLIHDRLEELPKYE